jgi:large subunit ribosomal protein L25
MLSLKAEKRTIVGPKVKQLRKRGLIPAVIYGHKIEPRNLTVSYLDFEKVYRQAKHSNLINLIIDNEKPVPVLIRDVQIDPLTNKFQHVDFYQIKTGEEIRLEIDLKFVGEAPAVKEKGGILITPLNKVEIECLPENLINEIEVDISGLKTFDDVIRIKDLKLPKGVKVITPANEVVALVKPSAVEEELKGLEEKPVERVEEVEVIKEKKKEEKEEEAEI